jgi:hypothetical protein
VVAGPRPDSLSWEAGHAEIESRSRRRVVDRCLANARAALVEERWADADASLTEAGTIDPDHPDVRALGAELRERRREAVARRPRDRWWPSG